MQLSILSAQCVFGSASDCQWAAMRAGDAGYTVSGGKSCGVPGGLHSLAHPGMAVHSWQLPSAVAEHWDVL